MIPLKKSLALALGLVVLATVAVLITTSTVGASPRLNPIAAAPPPPSVPVTVVNTPLPVTGTVNANVTGAVNATLTNASINVGNPATAPVLVRDVDNGQRPYQQTLFMTATGGSTPDPGCSSITQCEANITVPPGTRFVVEHVSVWVQGQGGQKYIAALKGNTANFVVLNFQGTFSTLDDFTASDAMHVYVDGSTPPPFVFVTSTNGQAFTAEFAISGYLVNLPQ